MALAAQAGTAILLFKVQWLTVTSYIYKISLKDHAHGIYRLSSAAWGWSYSSTNVSQSDSFA
jgi:hypothetical protein